MLRAQIAGGLVSRGTSARKPFGVIASVRRNAWGGHVTGPDARSQAKWLELSSNAKQLFTDKSSEYIPFDQPNFVVDAIHEVYIQNKQ
jgi:hypothetical protein